MADIVNFPIAEKVDDYFGLCPTCKNTNGYLNIGGEHWFHCDEHKMKWSVGYNIFSDWRDEPVELHQVNFAYLSGFHKVEPWFYPKTIKALEKALEELKSSDGSDIDG